MATQPDQAFDYDVFISYSHHDSEWVNGELLPRLTDAGLKVCIDHRDFQVGASFVFEMERAVKTSRHTLLVLTPAYVESDWSTFENMLVASRDPFNLQRSLIPLLVKPCELPERISSYIYVNFTAPGDPEPAWRQLLRAVGVQDGDEASPASALPAAVRSTPQQMLTEEPAPSRRPLWAAIAVLLLLLLTLLGFEGWRLWWPVPSDSAETTPSAATSTEVAAVVQPSATPTVEALAVATPVPTFTAQGPSIFAQSVPETDDDGAFLLIGQGAPGAIIEVQIDGAPDGKTEVGTDSLWAYDVLLDTPGEHEITVSGSLDGLDLPMQGVAARLNVPSPTPTATPEPSPLPTSTPDQVAMSQVVAAAVAATLAAQPTNTPSSTHTATPAPTVTLTPTLALDAPIIFDRLMPDEFVAGQVEFMGSGEPGTDVELVVDGEVLETATVDEEGSWSLVVALASGEYDIGVQARAGETLLPAGDAPMTIAVLEPTSTSRPTATPTPDETATRQAMAVALAATMTALPTKTSASTPTATATATPSSTEPAAGTVREFGGIPFVYVPAGEFLMGNTDDEVGIAFDLCQQYRDDVCQRSWYEDELPQHRVEVDAYWIMQTEVTNAMWQAFLNGGGYSAETLWSETGWQWRTENDIEEPSCWEDENFNSDLQPVVCVSGYEAEAFANWMSIETGFELRLPTEAEWEKAARGTDGRLYPWGAEFDGTLVNYCDKNCDRDWRDESADDSYAYTAPVGSYPDGASPYGALDMAGNVWEWTADWYDSDYYAASPDENPTGPESGSSRVVRGGSWFSPPVGVRAAHRVRYNPDLGFEWLGLRLASPGF